METQTKKLGVYRHIKYGVEDTGIVGSYSDEYILVSNVVEIEFEIIDSSAEKDALKALKVEAIQNRIKLAQKELDALL